MLLEKMLGKLEPKYNHHYILLQLTDTPPKQVVAKDMLQS